MLLRSLTKIACVGFILALPLEAMHLEQEQEAQNNNQEQSQAKEVKSLKVQALLQVAQSSEISDEQISQLPQDLQKVTLLIRSTQGDVTKAFFKALKVREDLFEVARRLARLNDNNVQANVDTQKLLEQGYSLEDIRILIKCGADINSHDYKGRLALVKVIRTQDNALLSVLLEEKLSILLNGSNQSLLLWLVKSLDDLRFGCRQKPNLELVENLIKAGADLNLEIQHVKNIIVELINREKDELNRINIHAFDKYYDQLIAFFEEQRAKKQQNQN